MPRKDSPETEAGNGKTVYKGMSLNAFGSNAITTAVDVKGGKILRIRPLHYDSKYDPKTFNQWKFEHVFPNIFFLTLHQICAAIIYRYNIIEKSLTNFGLGWIIWDFGNFVFFIGKTFFSKNTIFTLRNSGLAI